jgi:hypothetical protein
MATFFYDRVNIFADGVAYLPDGQIRSFSMDVMYNSKQLHGFNPAGISSGQIVGNKYINTIRWEEFLVDANDFVNWRTFTIANPNAIITVIPISLATGVPTAPQFTISGINVSSIAITAASEGTEITRVCNFNAQDSSNT